MNRTSIFCHRARLVGYLTLMGVGVLSAQAPPPVPALPDSIRITNYTLAASSCACSVGFNLYQDGTDIDNMVHVYLNGTRYLSSDATFGWTLSSVTGSFGLIPLPVTDAVLTYNSVQTGTLVIRGAQRPRRLTEFSESRGVPARDHNLALNALSAQLRENWDDVAGAVRAQPGEVLTRLPNAAARVGSVLGFDSGGQPNLIPYPGASALLPMTAGGTGASLTAGVNELVYSGATAMALLPAPSIAGLCFLSNGGSPGFGWASCGGAAAVASISNADGTLTISPTTGVAVASLALGHANTWTAAQTHANSGIKLLGSSTGATTFTSANAGASNFTWTWPAATDTVAGLNTADQTLAGGANVTSLSIATGNFTVDCGARPLQFITNGANFTITAPASDGSCMILMTNNATAGTVTLTGFTVGASTGATLTTTNTNKFTLSVWRINGTSGYTWFAHQ